MVRSYSELCAIDNYEDRLRYVFIGGEIGLASFGAERQLNQVLYTSKEWRDLRHRIIARDQGRELAMPGYELEKDIVVHHLNPITVQDVMNRADSLFDPENLVCISRKYHNLIHYGTLSSLFDAGPTERRPGDTTLW